MYTSRGEDFIGFGYVFGVPDFLGAFFSPDESLGSSNIYNTWKPKTPILKGWFNDEKQHSSSFGINATEITHGENSWMFEVPGRNLKKGC